MSQSLKNVLDNKTRLFPIIGEILSDSAVSYAKSCYICIYLTGFYRILYNPNQLK